MPFATAGSAKPPSAPASGNCLSAIKKTMRSASILPAAIRSGQASSAAYVFRIEQGVSPDKQIHYQKVYRDRVEPALYS
jgi:hypothetical protein